jgi:hypothetical protein
MQVMDTEEASLCRPHHPLLLLFLARTLEAPAFTVEKYVLIVHHFRQAAPRI